MTQYIADESKLIRSAYQTPAGRAASFDGVNDYITVGSPAALQLSSGSFAMTAWLNATVSNGTVTTFASCGGSGWIWQASQFWYRGAWRAYGSNVVPTGSWYHFAAVFDDATDTLVIYRNGAAIATIASVTGTYGTGGEVLLGRYGGNYVNGKMKDLRVYDDLLTPAEIAALYNATKAPGGDVAGTNFADRLVGWWPLEDLPESAGYLLTESYFRDISGNNNHGLPTANGIATYAAADVPCSIKGELGVTLAIGSEQIVQGDFPAGQTAWTNFSGQSTFSTNFATVKSTDGSYQSIAQNTATIAGGVMHRIRYRILADRGGNIASDTFNGITLPKTLGYNEVFAKAGGSVGSTQLFNIKRSGVTDIDIADISVVPWEERYALATDLTKDYTGATLQHRGPLAKRATMTGSPCATFDGVNDYAATAGAALDFERTQAFSVSGWLYRGANAQQFFIGTSLGTGTWRGWSLGTRFGFGRKLQLDLINTVNSNHLSAYTTLDTITEGEWQHVAATYDGSSTPAGIKLYVNGVLQPMTTGFNALSATTITGGACRVAAHLAGGNWLNGRMANWQVFTSVLTPEHIASLANEVAITPSPVSHWKMSEKSGLRLLDSSPNGNHLTAANMTSNELWANTQNVYHSGVAEGIRSVQGRRGYRNFTGSNNFELASSSRFHISPTRGLWFAARVKMDTVASTQYLISKYDSGAANRREWGIALPTGGGIQVLASTDGTSGQTSTTMSASTVTAGQWALVFGYIDPAGNRFGAALNNDAVPSNTFNWNVYNGTAKIGVGCSFADDIASNRIQGDMDFACIGRVDLGDDMTAIRNVLWNGGNPISYADLTDTQKTLLDLEAWYDCDEWGPVLRDKHSGNHMTGTGFSADYPLPAYPALDAEPARHFGTFDGASHNFEVADAAGLSMSGDDVMWCAGWFRVSNLDANPKMLLGQWDSGTNQRSWLLYALNNDVRFSVSGNGSTSTDVTFADQLAIGQWVFAFAYHDPAGNLIGVAQADSAFTTAAHSAGIFNSTGTIRLGARGNSAVEFMNGDIAFAAYGKAPAATFAQIRDSLYNSGTPLTYDQLEATLRTSFGLTEWFEVGDYDGSMQLVGRHAGTVLTGSCIPSRTTHGGPRKLAPVDTALNFTGGVAAPWTDKMFLGYWTCAGTANGISVWDAINGKVTDRISVYARWRNVDVQLSTARTIFGIDKSDGSNLWAVYLDDTGVLTVYDGDNRFIVGDISAKFTDGKWHDILATYYNGVITGYIDGTTIGTVATTLVMPTMAAQWNRAAVLSNPNGTSNRFKGDIARIVVSNALRTPADILSAANILDIRFDYANLEDQQGRCASTPAPAGMTPAKLTVPTAYKHGVLLPEGMQKDSNGVSESRFTLYSLDV